VHAAPTAVHCKGRFTRYDLWSLLSYATFVARSARVKQTLYRTLHSNILIVATTVVGFQKDMFQNPTTFFVLCAAVVKMLYVDLDDTIRFVDVT